MDTIFQIGLSNSATALVLAVVAAMSGLRGGRPALVHALWVLVLVKLITPPLVWIYPAGKHRAGAPPEPVQAPRVVDGSQSQVSMRPGDFVAPSKMGLGSIIGTPVPLPPSQKPRDLQRAIATRVPMSTNLLAFGACLVLAISWWVWVAWRVGRFLRLLRWARPAPESVQSRATRLAPRVGLKRAPDVWFVPSAISPMLWSIGMKPRLLLPDGLWKQLSVDQADALLVHELAHFKRRDHWVRLLEIAVTGLYWWNPLLWWARRSLHSAEEQCCDAWVVRTFPANSEAYATAILATVDYLAGTTDPMPLASTGLTSANELKHRLVRILQDSRSAPLSRPMTIALIGLGTAVLALGPSYQTRPYFRATKIDRTGREEEVGYELLASSMNDHGQVAGGWASQDPRYLHINGYQIWHPFLTQAGESAVTSRTEELSPLFVEQQHTWVKWMNARLNNRGHVLIAFQGQVNRQVNPYRQVQIHRGLLIDGRRVLDLAPGMSTTPAAINDAGQIVGTAHVRHDWTEQQKRVRDYQRYPPPTSSVAFRIPAGRPLDLSKDDLGHLGGPNQKYGTRHTEAFDINALGQVVGTSAMELSPVSGGGLGHGHAFRTAPNQPIDPLTDDLGSLAPGLGSVGRAINDFGQVAGWSPVVTSEHGTQDHAFRTGPNQPIDPLTDDLGTLGGIWSRASDINNRGDVVGTADVDAVRTHAFFYTGQTMFDLNHCVELEPGWELEEVLDLRDSGEMLARASNRQVQPWQPRYRSYLLVPTPQGVPIVALVLGMAGTSSGLLFRVGAWRGVTSRLLAGSLALAQVVSRLSKGGDRIRP